MRRVPQEKRAARPEVSGDAMMHMIGREPVDSRHIDAQAFDNAAAQVFPFERVVLRFRRLFDCPDETRAFVALHRKHRQKIRLVERKMQLFVHYRTGRFHVGDVEQMLVGPSRKAGMQGLADD